MGNTEMTKYMAAGAFADISSFKSTFDNSANWLKGLAASGMYGGKLYGVPYYAGSRVVTYRTDVFKKAGITQAADQPRAVHRRRSASSRRRTAASKGFSPVYIAGTDWYFAMSFVYDYGGLDREDVARQVGRQPRLAAVDRGPDRLQELLLDGRRRRARRSDENNPAPYTVYSQGGAGSIVGPGWFSCCVGTKYKTTTAQFVMPSHTQGQPMPGFLGGSDLAVPVTSEQGARRRLDQGLHEHELGEGAPGEGQHPERDEPARHERQRAGRRPQLVRAGREALGRRRERQYPAQHARADPDRQADGAAGGEQRERQHHVGAQQRK